MFFLPAAIGSFLIVNLLCGCVALGVGFAAGVWFFGAKLAKVTPPLPQKKASPSDNFHKRTVERTVMAAARMADLAQNVASDVGDHAAAIKAISADLAGIDRGSTGTNETVFAALDQMISANAKLQQRLEQAEKQLADQANEIRSHEADARTDSLTGIANRRAFDDELKRRLSEFERKQVPCSLLLFDIDFFKKFNDTHGHQVGDEVLRSVAKVLKMQSREMDLPCRYGGEEFAVILPSTELKTARHVAERIRAAIEASTTTCEGKSLKVTCSIGLSAFQAGDDCPALIRRADEALYASKEAGRNCGHWHNGVACLPLVDPVRTVPPEASKEKRSTESPSTNCGTPDARAQTTSPGTFFHILKRRVTEGHRFGIPLSIVHLAIEDLDAFDRKYGPHVGRQMIEVAGQCLEKGLREIDAIARLDNGEYVLMLPGNTQAEAAQTTKRLRMATRHRVLPLVDGELTLRFRSGVAELKPNETAKELLARARQLSLVSTDKPFTHRTRR